MFKTTLFSKIFIAFTAIHLLTGCSESNNLNDNELPRNILMAKLIAGPVQTKVEEYSIDSYFADITVKADYSITARVHSQKYYNSDRQAKLIPFDIAISWGNLALDGNFERLKTDQRRRWVYWRSPAGFLKKKEINTSLSNTHIIPASKDIADKMKDLKKGQIVHLEGHLVDAVIDKKYLYRSSMSRTDTGDGACEVFYVTSAKIFNYPATKE